MLLQELKLIEDRKKLGFDVSEEYEHFKQKFKLTKELKEKFLFQENLLRELEEKSKALLIVAKNSVKLKFSSFAQLFRSAFLKLKIIFC